MLRLDDDIQTETTVEIFGISAHVRPYRMCWALNRSLQLELYREEDHFVERGGTTLGFSRFTYQNEDEEIRYTLFQNIRPEGHLVPDLKHADFLFVIQYGENIETRPHISPLQETEFVNTVFSLATDSWKDMYLVLGADGF